MARRGAAPVAVSGPLVAVVDAMEQSYVDWREHSETVGLAYRRWETAPPGERRQRFAAYAAALDQEEAAATRYAELVRDTSRVLRRMTPRRSP